MVDENVHSFASVHRPTSVHVDSATPTLRERVDTQVRLCQGVHNRDTLRLELMREPIENGGTTRFNRLFEGVTDGVKIIQQME